MKRVTHQKRVKTTPKKSATTPKRIKCMFLTSYTHHFGHPVNASNHLKKGDHSVYILKKGSFRTKCNKMGAMGVEIHIEWGLLVQDLPKQGIWMKKELNCQNTLLKSHFVAGYKEVIGNKSGSVTGLQPVGWCDVPPKLAKRST